MSNVVTTKMHKEFLWEREIEEGRLKVICTAKTLNLLFGCSCRLIARPYSIAVIKAAASGGVVVAKSNSDLVHCVAQMVVYRSDTGEIELCRWNSACKGLETHSQ
jgi:hypothetical protein